MAVFTYDPNAARTWANSVVNYLNGGSDSVSNCSQKFGEQLEKLVQPNVWTGDAARQNYEDFMETHRAMLSFINAFGDAFQEAMNEVNTSVANLESSNLGSSNNLSDFGTLSYDQISALAESNITTEFVRYDYATISDIGSNLNSIKSTLEDVKTNLSNKINEIGGDSTIWGGNSADSARENLDNTLTTNMSKVFECLERCISNISTAAQNAQQLDVA